MTIELSTIPTTQEAIAKMADLVIMKRNENKNHLNPLPHKIIYAASSTELLRGLEYYQDLGSLTVVLSEEEKLDPGNEIQLSSVDLDILESWINTDLTPEKINALPEDHPFVLIQKAKELTIDSIEKDNKRNENQQEYDRLVQDTNIKLTRFIGNLLSKIKHDSTDIKILDNIFAVDLDAFVSQDGIKDFKKIMSSSKLDAQTKAEIFASLLERPNLSQLGYENNKAFLRDILNSFSYNTSGILTMVKFIKAISKNERITKDLKDTATAFPDIIDTFRKLFAVNPDEMIEFLNKDNYSTIFKKSQTDLFTLVIVNSMGEYLNNPANPIEKKVKLFCDSFKKLCKNVKPDDPLAPRYYELFVSYFSFFQKNWHNEQVKAVLKDSWASFIQHFSKIPPDILKNVSESAINKIQEDKEALKKEGFFDNNILSSIMLASLKNKSSKEKAENCLNFLLPELHKQNISNFSKMIVIENKAEEKPLVLPRLNEVLGGVVSNQKGYDEGITFTNQNGAPLSLKNGTPIGYNVHLPKNEVKGVFVSVYGGFQAKDRTTKVFHPTALNDVELDMLSKGYAVVSLNLVDLLELNVSQGRMPQYLHNRLHDSIHQFYETLKNDPKVLHPTLDILKDKPLYLYGASFGGRTAIKHAELHPKTFDGYISFDGALSHEMEAQSDSEMVNRPIGYYELQAAQWLDPAKGIENIEDPVLLLHNMNDNNVNLKVTLDWYKKAKNAGKEALVRLHITGKGNPTVEKDLHNTGHFQTREGFGFEAMTQAMTTFMEQGAPGLPAIPEWEAFRTNILADKHYRLASVEKRFVSEAYSLYKEDHRRSKGRRVSDEDWKTRYVPIYYTQHHINTLSKDMVACHREVNALKNNGLLTPKVISKALELYLSNLLTFIKEKDGLLIPKDIDIEKLAQNPELQQDYIRSLTDIHTTELSTMRYLMSTLYMANPELLKDQFKEYDEDPKMQNYVRKARTKLNAKIEKEHKLAIKTWHQVVHKMRKSKLFDVASDEKKLDVPLSRERDKIGRVLYILQIKMEKEQKFLKDNQSTTEKVFRYPITHVKRLQKDLENEKSPQKILTEAHAIVIQLKKNVAHKEEISHPFKHFLHQAERSIKNWLSKILPFEIAEPTFKTKAMHRMDIIAENIDVMAENIEKPTMQDKSKKGRKIKKIE